MEIPSEEEQGQQVLVPLTQIRSRTTHTRPLQPKHVADLAESIAALGLIEPLVLDNHHVLLAGSHRLAAIQILKEKNPQIYAEHFRNDFVPVRIMAFDSTTDSERALQVELAENEKRVNYSRDQIEQLAERLRVLNYRDTRGRPKVGEKALGPALAVAVGVSTRYVRKVLREQKVERTGKKNRNSDPIFQRIKLLRRIQVALEELSSLPQQASPTDADQELEAAIPTFLEKVKASIKDMSKP
ncbi:MAG: ParB N-terminal domain-containing protein [Leptolyngbyaceae cyanobacterium MO_188.B28]|nr:ParB N-terminal domain-containing protein [Leptolyngbyaceae cyanobacterium MO_188.B28]